MNTISVFDSAFTDERFPPTSFDMSERMNIHIERTAKWADVEELSIKRVSPRWVFYSDNRTVIALKPIQIKIEKGEGAFFAENENLGIFAIGDTLEKAVEDFSHHVVYFFYHYKKLKKDKAIGKAIKLKEIYETTFKSIV